MGQSPFWWIWISLIVAILFFIIFRVKVALDPANPKKQGVTKPLLLLVVLVSMLLSYYLGNLKGATETKILLLEKNTIYEVISKPFRAGTNTCIVLQPTKLGIITMEWRPFGEPKIYTLTETITNEPGTRIIGVANGERVEVKTHPLQPTPN